ncbi:MAG: dihydrolipoyl dehydrogenase [Actinomycetia bacterium]|nr:dihydrolipoyl dehydrogenase [Actinomycetes bacterium]
MAEQYDLVVLGGGTGGYVAAIRAAQLGLKTAVVEREKVGGTCLHRGCIPTKALLHTAEVLNTFRHAADLGIAAGDPVLDYPRAMARKDRVVNQLWRGVQYLLRKNGVTVVAGTGRLRPGGVEVAGPDGTRSLDARDVLVATGSAPRALPGLPFDGERVLSSDDVLERPVIPRRLVIVGGGAIGVEFASMYADFGTEVTLLEMMPHILPQDDAEVAAELTRILSRRGVMIHAGATVDVAGITVSDTGVRVPVRLASQDTATFEGDALLVAVGREPLTADIGLESVGVTVNRGFIEVDALYRTKAPHVWAIGDCIGGLLLAHVAAHEGIIAVEAIAGQKPEPLDPRRVPRVTYCRPEVASVGLTAEEAEAAGRRVKVGKFPFQANGRSLILGEAEGFVKLVADADTDDLLGAHIIGPHASDLVNEMALARFLEATPWEVGTSVHAHPTVSEVLHEAAFVVEGHPIHI